MTSPNDLLSATNAAILACLTAQDYTIAGRRKTMAQLTQLQEFRKSLMDEISNGGSGGGMATLLSMGEPAV
jgi:hypothetical protein